MGCDIHCYVEYKEKERKRWRGFGGRINPGRNYMIFALLANVRNYWNVFPVLEQRGLPENLWIQAKNDNELFVTVEETDEEGCTTPERAAKWVEIGISKYTDESKKWVTNPDWHSHSWCTASELREVLDRTEVDAEFKYQMPEWEVLYEVLRSFEKKGYNSRLVFWFDN